MYLQSSLHLSTQLMKPLSAGSILLLLSFNLFAQDFPGYRAGNYTGVNGVFFNPAHIADSRYRYDVNLFSFSTLVGNNQASFKLKSPWQSSNKDSLKNQVFGNNAGPSSGTVSVDIHGPSLMFNVGEKSAVAITTRARTMANIFDLDGKLARQLTDDFKDDPQLPYTISSTENMRTIINSWTEIGASFGRVLADKGSHFLKVGLHLNTWPVLQTGTSISTILKEQLMRIFFYRMPIYLIQRDELQPVLEV
jgi:hypothetical protein